MHLHKCDSVSGAGGVAIKQLAKIVLLISTQPVSVLVHCKVTQWAFQSCLVIRRYLLRGVRAAPLCRMNNARTLSVIVNEVLFWIKLAEMIALIACRPFFFRFIRAL